MGDAGVQAPCGLTHCSQCLWFIAMMCWSGGTVTVVQCVWHALAVRVLIICCTEQLMPVLPVLSVGRHDSMSGREMCTCRSGTHLHAGVGSRRWSDSCIQAPRSAIYTGLFSLDRLLGWGPCQAIAGCACALQAYCCRLLDHRDSALARGWIVYGTSNDLQRGNSVGASLRTMSMLLSRQCE